MITTAPVPGTPRDSAGSTDRIPRSGPMVIVCHRCVQDSGWVEDNVRLRVNARAVLSGHPRDRVRVGDNVRLNVNDRTAVSSHFRAKGQVQVQAIVHVRVDFPKMLESRSGITCQSKAVAMACR